MNYGETKYKVRNRIHIHIGGSLPYRLWNHLTIALTEQVGVQIWLHLQQTALNGLFEREYK